jgi:hypothetical protein
MSWTQLPREHREKAVAQIDALIDEESPDRFWYSTDQDGDRTQEMSILLPYGNDTYYHVKIQTTQLRALRLLAGSYGYTAQSTSLPHALLDRAGIVGEEQFEIDSSHDTGILYDIILDVPGLTHVVVDSLLDDFLHRGGVPPQPKKTNPVKLVKRLVEAESGGYLASHFPL